MQRRKKIVARQKVLVVPKLLLISLIVGAFITAIIIELTQLGEEDTTTPLKQAEKQPAQTVAPAQAEPTSIDEWLTAPVRFGVTLMMLCVAIGAVLGVLHAWEKIR